MAPSGSSCNYILTDWARSIIHLSWARLDREVHRFQDTSLEHAAEARTRAQSRPEDMIPIYRRRTSVDSASRETSHQARYMVVDSVEALNKFGPDVWKRVVCVLTTGQR